MTYQIIYSSEATIPMQTGDLEALLEQARRRNAARGITGALVYAEGVFLQILEGDREPLEALLEKIRRDVRHEHVVVLRAVETAAASFGSWKMAYVSATRQQVAAWAGIAVANDSSDSPNDTIEEQQRTAQFARDILALLAADDSVERKVD